MNVDLLDAPGERSHAAAPMDPRLRARRLKVARDTGRRRRRRLVFGVLAVALIAAVVGLIRSPLLDVDQVVVRGARSITDDEIREAADIEPGRPLVGLDTGAAAARLEALPWIASAEVSWTWSGTVTVEVEERTAVAVAGRGSDAALVDRSGQVLGPASSSVELPGVAGSVPEPGEHLAARQLPAVEVLADLPAAIGSQVLRGSAGQKGVTLELSDGIEVVWGAPGRTAAKAHDLQLVLAQAGRRSIERIDVSVPGAPALTRRAGGGG